MNSRGQEGITSKEESHCSKLMGADGRAEDYWIAHPEAEIRVKPSFHEGYGWSQPQLEQAIRAIHAQVMRLTSFLVDSCCCIMSSATCAPAFWLHQGSFTSRRSLTDSLASPVYLDSMLKLPFCLSAEASGH